MIEIKSKDIQMINSKELVPHPKNMHRHSPEQIERLCNLIEYQGFRTPLTVQKGTNLIVTGHGRLMAAKKLGMEKVPVTYQEFDDEAQLYAHIVADNAIGKDTWATLDLSQINLDIQDLGPELDIDMLGLKDFTIEPLDRLEPQCDEDAVPEVEHPITRRGDVWLLGEHRVMCGDSTDMKSIELLTQGSMPSLCFTDPPYGMSAVSKSGVLSANYSRDILNDDNVDVAKEAWQCGVTICKNSVFWGANYYSSALPDATCWLVWDKNNGGSDQMDAELAWTNFKGVTRLFKQASEKKNRVHPTQKPVSLAEWCFDKFKIDGSVLDLFLGSGSTLIACEKTNRKCYGMELDEHYCDVIIKRWEQYTGKKATLESTGQTYEELMAVRNG